MLLMMFMDISCDMSEVSVMNNSDCTVILIAYKHTNAHTGFCREGTHGTYYYYLSKGLFCDL
jgi:hypothetical protein